jgi:sulfate adenylyltransferase subunit 1 (EFTu-like GTPase family)
MDLVNYAEERFQEVKKELLQFLAGLKIRAKFFIPISAKEGENISKKSKNVRWYKGPVLLEALDKLSVTEESVKKPLRLAIQDIYEIKNEKIIVGRLLSGAIKPGQEVTLLPSLKNTVVNSLKTFGKNPQKACATENIGLVLDDSTLAKRGEVIVEKFNLPKFTDRFRAEIFWLAEEPLQINKPITFRCATQETSCIVKKIEKRINSSTLEILEENAKELKSNEAGVVILETEKPVVLENFEFIEELGRFVLEKNYNVQGAGIITHNSFI